MNELHVTLLGRFGNQLFQYCHARARALSQNAQLHVIPWVGQEIFQLSELPADPTQARVLGYGQRQCDILYTAEQARYWLRFKPEIRAKLGTLPIVQVLAHRRCGDYFGYGYPVVSEASYLRCCLENGLPPSEFVTEENPVLLPDLPDALSFLPDFWRMLNAPVLLRGNSSFSWWAALLGGHRVFAPVVEGLAGGKEHECRFVEGNWPRLANLDCVTDLHMPGYNDSMRYTYALTPESLVIDLGCHHGQFSRLISDRYNCRVAAYEPMPDFCQISREALAAYPKVVLTQAAVGPRADVVTHYWKGDMSGAYASGEPHQVQQLAIADVIPASGCDLLKINIEGGEYGLLEAMLEADLVKLCQNIQVQFHALPSMESRYASIRDRLLTTHHHTYCFPFCWENYERNY